MLSGGGWGVEVTLGRAFKIWANVSDGYVFSSASFRAFSSATTVSAFFANILNTYAITNVLLPIPIAIFIAFENPFFGSLYFAHRSICTFAFCVFVLLFNSLPKSFTDFVCHITTVRFFT